MSQRSMTLPLRLSSSTRLRNQAWTCRRCLATQTAIEAPFTPVEGALSSTSHPVAAQYGDPRLPSSQRGASGPLSKTDRLLKQALPHPVPEQYLQHTTADFLPKEEMEARARTKPHKKIVGVVVSAGKMAKTVKVRVPGQRWEPRIRKYFADHTDHLVHDPNSSLVLGDMVSLHRLRVSTSVHHVVGELITPYGVPREQRPPIPSPEERLAEYKEHRFQKLHRQSLRRQAALGNAKAISKLKAMRLDPGQGVEAGEGEKENVTPGSGKTRGGVKGAILGNKGQKLPKGVLPGGEHEVGKIDERAKHNKESAMNMQGKSEQNIAEAERKAADAEAQRESAEPASAIPRA